MPGRIKSAVEESREGEGREGGRKRVEGEGGGEGKEERAPEAKGGERERERGSREESGKEGEDHLNE